MIKIILLILFSGLMYYLIKDKKSKNYEIKEKDIKKKTYTNQWKMKLEPRKEYNKIFNENRKNKNNLKKDKYKKWLVTLSLLASILSMIAYNKTINNHKNIYDEIKTIKNYIKNITEKIKKEKETINN